MEGHGLEPKMVPSLSRNPSLRLSPIEAAGRSSPPNRDACGLGSKKRSASQLFSFCNDDSAADSAELVEVLSNPASTFAPISDPSPRTFASIRDGIGALSSQSSPRLLSSPCVTSPLCLHSSSDGTPSALNCGSAALSPAVFNRLSLASSCLPASSPTFFPHASWVASGMLGPSDACGDLVETSAGRDLLSPFDMLTDYAQSSNSTMPPSVVEESFDGNTSGHTQFSQAVTASNPGTPFALDSSTRSTFPCALARSSSFGELSRLTEEAYASSPVVCFPARSMSVSTISSSVELHLSSGSGGLSFLFFKRSRDGLNALSAQTLASMLRGGSNVDPPLLCPSTADPSALRAGASCPLSQQLSAEGRRFTVVDARYDFEFSGGHIEGAISINKASELAEFFFPDQRRAEREGAPIPPPPLLSEHVYVFHCEYSQKRGPELLKALRELDRHYNSYPNLTYPQLYILDEGYKHFFETHSYCCDGGYIPMKDQHFKTDLAIAKKACCHKRAKVSSVRATRLPMASIPHAQEINAARSNGFIGCSGSFVKFPCD